MHPRRPLGWGGALLLLLLLPLPRAAVRAAPPAPVITLAKDADLGSLMGSVHRGMPGAVVADIAFSGKCRQPMESLPLEQALPRISMDYDRCWIRRGRALALQIRYTDPREGIGLEYEELRGALADMDRVISAFAPRLSGVPYIRAQRDFVASVTQEQQTQMLGVGLPWRALAPAQRAAWLGINASKALSNEVRMLRRGAFCLAQWNGLTGHEASIPGQKRLQLHIPFADAAEPSGKAGCMVVIPRYNRSARPVAAEGWGLPLLATPAPAALRPQWDLPPQQMDLGILRDKLLAADGPSLQFPGYARGRTFWIASNGGTRREVLTALADLWGWELTSTKTGWRLDRPRVPPAKDALDLHRKLRRLVPPSLRHLIKGRMESTERTGVQMDRVLENADRIAGKDWESFPLAKLDPENQRRLANVIATEQVLNWYHIGSRELPPAWMLRPQNGVFKLSGPLGPDAKPLLSFWDDEGTGWGFVVNDDTLGR